MTLRRWLYLFVTTLIIGGLGGLLAGVLLLFKDYSVLPDMAGYDWWINLRDFFLAGTLFSILSQAGFFAYMMLNFIVRGAMKPATWNVVQFILIGAAITYLEIMLYDKTSSIFMYIIMPTGIFLFAWLVSYFKIKMTNSSALIPTIFFMVAATSFEAASALKGNTIEGVLLGLLPLLLCNAWQILQLTNLTNKGSAKGSSRAAVTSAAKK